MQSSSRITRLSGGILLILCGFCLLCIAQASRVSADASITFAPPTSTSLNGAGDVATCDFDQDGHLDIAVDADKRITILYGDGSGGFSPVDYLDGESQAISEVFAADINADNRPDLIYLRWGAHQVVVRVNLGGRSFDTPLTYPVAQKPYGVCAGDFDEDGWNDLAVSTDNGNRVCVLANEGDGSFSTFERSPRGASRQGC